jgi:hypothetical protein
VRWDISQRPMRCVLRECLSQSCLLRRTVYVDRITVESDGVASIDNSEMMRAAAPSPSPAPSPAPSPSPSPAPLPRSSPAQRRPLPAFVQVAAATQDFQPTAAPAPGNSPAAPVTIINVPEPKDFFWDHWKLWLLLIGILLALILCCVFCYCCAERLIPCVSFIEHCVFYLIKTAFLPLKFTVLCLQYACYPVKVQLLLLLFLSARIFFVFHMFFARVFCCWWWWWCERCRNSHWPCGSVSGLTFVHGHVCASLRFALLFYLSWFGEGSLGDICSNDNTFICLLTHFTHACAFMEMHQAQYDSGRVRVLVSEVPPKQEVSSISLLYFTKLRIGECWR